MDFLILPINSLILQPSNNTSLIKAVTVMILIISEWMVEDRLLVITSSTIFHHMMHPSSFFTEKLRKINPCIFHERWNKQKYCPRSL